MIRTIWTFLVGSVVLGWWGVAVIWEASRGRKPSAWYAMITTRWCRSVIWAAGCPMVVHGREHVREGVPQVIASNHISWFDVFALASVIEVPYHFVAKKELLKVPFFGRALEAAGHITIDRSNRDRAIVSLRAAGEKIRHTPAAVVIFPEGTRSSDGRLMPFKKGAFMLAAESGVTIVPTAITGSFEIMRKGSWRITSRTIHIHFLPPIPAHEVAALGAAGADPLMNAVYTRIAAVVGESTPAAA
ncbi:MAG TPA: lysophospholipid acyltransferase family protein [Longimicrobium sp.]|nr:lysophospholipid acyltransferase family protein [Longimicrobium sp.]